MCALCVFHAPSSRFLPVPLIRLLFRRLHFVRGPRASNIIAPSPPHLVVPPASLPLPPQAPPPPLLLPSPLGTMHRPRPEQRTPHRHFLSLTRQRHLTYSERARDGAEPIILEMCSNGDRCGSPSTSDASHSNRIVRVARLLSRQGGSHLVGASRRWDAGPSSKDP